MKNNQEQQPYRTYPHILTVTLLLLIALAVSSGTVWGEAGGDPPIVPNEPDEVSASRDGIVVIGKVCAVSWRCVAEGPGDWLFEEMLRLPALAGGGRSRGVMERFERAVASAVRSLARKRRYASLPHVEVVELVADRVADEYHATLQAALADGVREMKRGEHHRYGPGTDGHIAITAFTIDVLDSWAKGPTYRLNLKASFKHGTPTHLRIRCDNCRSLPEGSDSWIPYKFWDPTILVGGEGRLTVCLEARAEPYYGNYSNTDIACVTMDSLSSAGKREKGVAVTAEVNKPGQLCFGAIGNNCGDVEAGELEYGDYCVRHDPITEPDRATCFINGGSWEYDECCVAKRVGGDAPESEQGSCLPRIAKLLGQPLVCQAEREKVAVRQLMGLTWVREVDSSVANRDGKVAFEEYCAPSGTIVHWDEVPRYCCSRSGEQVIKHLGDSLTGLRWTCH
ncbi:MAG: hypothetical protein ACE5D4_02775 [Thermodesulfobacteriota bacterium]